MKKLLIIFLVLISIAFIYFLKYRSGEKFLKPVYNSQEAKHQKPLDKYTIDALSKTEFPASHITLGEVLEETGEFKSQIFYLNVDPSIDSGQIKKISGLINFPKSPGIYPVILMFRGYINREGYQTGAGTIRAGQFFAKNGFITLAPDFLGYGSSDMPSTNPMEERFQTYTTALTLVESVNNLNEVLDMENGIRIDAQKIGIWGHSNGGQIALTVLEITGKNFPTVLWAPVSKPFPYSILYYTDDFDDHGKMLRKVIADFEKDYDVENYSLTNYYDWISTAIQLHQGGADEAVPQKWSDQLFEQLTKLGKDIEYYTYGGDDHNFAKGAWQTVVSRNSAFFQKQFNDSP